MSYADLLAKKGAGTPYDGLTPVSEDKLAALQQRFAGIPQDYLSFLRQVGHGELGPSYSIYDGLVHPREVYGRQSSTLMTVMLFGDDLAGRCAGFETTGWTVVEIEPNGVQVAAVAAGFAEFIRARIADLT